MDLLFEVRDARIPLSSKHPKSHELFGEKPRVIVLCKSDLADTKSLSYFTSSFSQEADEQALALSLKTQRGQDKLLTLALRLTASKRESFRRRGVLQRPARACVVGLPNVGKSSLINWFVGKKKAAVGNRPGITKGNSWIRIHPELELLDTPGMLPPISFRPETALKLALCNILPEDHYQIDQIAEEGLALMAQKYPRSLDIYRLAGGDTTVDLDQIAKIRSCLLPGGKLDSYRAACLFVNDFRNGKLGPVVLDELPETNTKSR